MCENGLIRLLGGSNMYEGRVEICINRVWGSVCDSSWDSTDASVACKQLGFSEHSKFNTELALFNGNRALMLEMQ